MFHYEQTKYHRRDDIYAYSQLKQEDIRCIKNNIFRIRTSSIKKESSVIRKLSPKFIRKFEKDKNRKIKSISTDQ